MSDIKQAFVCRRCGHVATTKQNLIKHLNRNVKCDIQEGMENISVEDHIAALLKQVNKDAVACRFCGTLFNQKRYITPHLQVCKHNPQSPNFIGIKPDNEKTDKQIIADLEEKLKQASKWLKKNQDTLSVKNKKNTRTYCTTSGFTNKKTS